MAPAKVPAHGIWAKRWQTVRKELGKAPFTAKFGLVAISIYIFIALFAPVISPYKESQVIGPEYLDIGQAYYTKDKWTY